MHADREHLLEAAVMWRPAHHTYVGLKKARKGYGWAANVGVLPLPPSTNNLFPGRERRYKSVEYRRWLAEAEEWWAESPISHQAAWPLDKQPVVLWVVDFYAFMPTWLGDLDNKFKAPIDYICTKTGLRDNRLVEIHAKRITSPNRLKGLVFAIGLA